MSFSIPLDRMTEDVKTMMEHECNIRSNKDFYTEKVTLFRCYEVNKEENRVYLPLALWPRLCARFPNRDMGTSISGLTELVPYTIRTDPKQYRDQDVVLKEAHTKLRENGMVFLALATGFGKTSLGILLTCRLGQKTLVLCHFQSVNRQWLDEFRAKTTLNIQLVRGDELDPAADVYIMGILKASKLDRATFRAARIGTLIVDEAHVATITAFTKSLLKLQPRFLIGLSATPQRADGMHRIFAPYFGPPRHYIKRHETKSFTVFKCVTPFSPSLEYTHVRGRTVLDWTKFINSLEYNEQRHHLVASIAMRYCDHHIMILSNRVAQSQGIYDILASKGEDVEKLWGNMKSEKCNLGARILVAGMQKAGIGFNDPRRDMLILASDAKNVKQYEGRIRTSNNLIFDMVDNHSTLENHWKVREKWYRRRGATIEQMRVTPTGELELFEEDCAGGEEPPRRLLKPLPSPSSRSSKSK